jgi:hypothetical protein
MKYKFYLRDTKSPRNCESLLMISPWHTGVPYNSLAVSVGDICLKKSCIGLEIMPQGAFTAFRVLLQTILLRDLVGCESPLQIVMAAWRL